MRLTDDITVSARAASTAPTSNSPGVLVPINVSASVSGAPRPGSKSMAMSPSIPTDTSDALPSLVGCTLLASYVKVTSTRPVPRSSMSSTRPIGAPDTCTGAPFLSVPMSS